MTTNEQDEVIEVEDIVETKDDQDNDTTDWKAEALKAQGIAKRLKTKADKAKVESKVEAKVEKKLEERGLDRLDRAVLRVEKITAEDEVGLVQDIMKESGKTLEQVLESKYFQSELKEMRESKATKEATPDGTKRSGQSPRTEVDYWIAKGELPKDNPELARKVVNAKMEKVKSGHQFSDTPVVY